MSGPWIKLFRKSKRSRVFSVPELWHLWCYLLLSANWKTKWFDGEEIKEGSLVRTCEQIGRELKCAKSTVHDRLRKLESWGMITQKSGRRFRVITICQWETYQKQKSGRRILAGSSPDSDRMEYRKNIDQKKKEKINKKKEEKLFIHSSKAFCEAWDEYVEFRRKQKKPLTPEATNRLVSKINSWSEQDAIESIHKTIENCWTGLFPVDRSRDPVGQNLGRLHGTIDIETEARLARERSEKAIAEIEQRMRENGTAGNGEGGLDDLF